MLAEIVLLGSNNTRYYYYCRYDNQKDICKNTPSELYEYMVPWREIMSEHRSLEIYSWICKDPHFHLYCEYFTSIKIRSEFWNIGKFSYLCNLLTCRRSEREWRNCWCCLVHQPPSVPCNSVRSAEWKTWIFLELCVWLHSPHDHTTLPLAPNSNDVS